jgi:hypothetical protein
MRSQLCFVMHPIDEQEFAAQVLSDDSVYLIDGPRWQASTPEVHRSLEGIAGGYCIVWSTQDCAVLRARHIPACNDWYCQSEFATIQFLRSQILDSVITQGRIAIGTSDTSEFDGKGVERRFKSLARYLKKHYANSVLCWGNPRLPTGSGGDDRSANPSNPDARVWVGPNALRWLKQDQSRCVKQSPSFFVEGRIVEAAA